MPKWSDRFSRARLHEPSGQAGVRIDGKEIHLGGRRSAEAIMEGVA